MAIASTMYIAVFLAAFGGREITARRSEAAFTSFMPRLELPKFGALAQPKFDVQLENQLLSAIENLGEENRLANSDEIASLVAQLEESPSSIPQPAISSQVMGRWRLLHTTNAATSSPIQRKAVDASKFPIYQDILLKETQEGDGDEPVLIVSQVVKFGDTAKLCVDALASTSQYPLAELTERESTGKVLGLNILGVSLVGEEAQEDPNRPDSRINFVFEEGKFDFGQFQVPYPVPFRNPLFRDWVKGWIDITYLSDRIRISRGNKGTTFILLKENEEAQAI